MIDPATALIRAIAARFGGQSRFEVQTIKSWDWASATFTGARHELNFHLWGDSAETIADDFLAYIEEAEFNLYGHILADIALVSRIRANDPGELRIELNIEALTIEDK